VTWWLPGLQPELSQGDIIQDLAAGLLVEPVRYLRHATLPKGLNGWAESDTPVMRANRLNYLAEGLKGLAVVISHDCEIDKGQSRVLTAPLKAISSVDAETQEVILAQRHWALAPLPDIPNLGTFFADFRSITPSDRRAVDRTPRLASMNSEAVKLLQARLVGFFTRLVLP
jgi:hypothetical protein